MKEMLCPPQQLHVRIGSLKPHPHPTLRALWLELPA